MTWLTCLGLTTVKRTEDLLPGWLSFRAINKTLDGLMSMAPSGLRGSYWAFTRRRIVGPTGRYDWSVRPVGWSVYTFRSSDWLVCPTQATFDWSVRPVGPTSRTQSRLNVFWGPWAHRADGAPPSPLTFLPSPLPSPTLSSLPLRSRPLKSS